MSQTHYENISDDFEKNWFFQENYVDELAQEIATHLSLESGESFLDLGCGTGNYTEKIAAFSKASNLKITGVDFSQKMIDQFSIQISNGIGICSDISQFASNNRTKFDKVLLKEVIHHIKNPTLFFDSVLKNLNPKGKVLIVTRPKVTQFPFFLEAKKEFAKNQPSVEEILENIKGDDLLKTSHEFDMHISISKKRLISMIRNRFMSTFEAFTNEEIEGGLVEVNQTYPGEQIRFLDRFIFISIIAQ